MQVRTFLLATLVAFFIPGCISIYQIVPGHHEHMDNRPLSVPIEVITTVAAPEASPAPMVDQPSNDSFTCDVEISPDLDDIPPLPAPPAAMFRDEGKVQDLLIRHVAELRRLLRSYREVIDRRSVSLATCY